MAGLFYLAVASLRADLVLAVILWLILVGLVLLSIGAACGNAAGTHEISRSAGSSANSSRTGWSLARRFGRQRFPRYAAVRVCR